MATTAIKMNYSKYMEHFINTLRYIESKGEIDNMIKSIEPTITPTQLESFKKQLITPSGQFKLLCILLTLRNISDTYHDHLGDAGISAIKESISSNCQNVMESPVNHFGESNFLELLGLTYEDRRISINEDPSLVFPYKITQLEFKDTDDLTQPKFSELRNIRSNLSSTPVNFVIDYAYGTPLANIIRAWKNTVNSSYNIIINPCVLLDPAGKSNEHTSVGKELKDAGMSFVDDTEKSILIPSSSKFFNCQTTDPIQPMKNHYQLFGGNNDVLISKTTDNEDFALILKKDAGDNIIGCTFGDSSFASKADTGASISINILLNFLERNNTIFGKETTLQEFITAFKRDFREAQTHTSDHVLLKRLGDASQLLSCFDYDNNTFIVFILI